uniref:Uncharacterized protein n=1 Tax=Panagrolaimus sp. PS1159 TaxID=55785 RepID=A0AC35FIW9_9BILA
MDEKKELTSKNTALESRLFTVSEENAELTEMVENYKGLAEKNHQEQPTPSQSNLMSESFVTEFTDLQDQVDKLNEDKITLQSRIRELENDIGNMVQKIESLESTNAELHQALTSVNKENKQLAKENKELAENATFLQIQIDTMSAPKVDQKERGNSLFGEVDEAREKAEEELRKVVEQNVLLHSEIDALQIRLRRYAHSNLTHADQVEIEFQKKHSEQIFARLQEYIKENERYAQQIQDLNNKIIAFQGAGGTVNESMASVIVKRQLELATKELSRLRKLYDEQNVLNHELGLKVLEIPGLKASIKRYENKVASLEDELKMSKELHNINNKAAMTTKSNKENVAPRLNMLEVPSTPKESKLRPRLLSPSRTLPSKAPSATSWADRLKNDYKHTARQNRERSLDFRRGSRFVSMPKEDPKV